MIKHILLILGEMGIFVLCFISLGSARLLQIPRERAGRGGWVRERKKEARNNNDEINLMNVILQYECVPYESEMDPILLSCVLMYNLKSILYRRGISISFDLQIMKQIHLFSYYQVIEIKEIKKKVLKNL